MTKTIKNCVVCGQPFEANRASRVTCGSPACKQMHHAEYVREYLARRRKEHRDEVNEYNRKWMQTYRKQKPKEDTLTGEGYAERQMRKTLESVGCVKL